MEYIHDENSPLIIGIDTARSSRDQTKISIGRIIINDQGDRDIYILEVKNLGYGVTILELNKQIEELKKKYNDKLELHRD